MVYPLGQVARDPRFETEMNSTTKQSSKKAPAAKAKPAPKLAKAAVPQTKQVKKPVVPALNITRGKHPPPGRHKMGNRIVTVPSAQRARDIANWAMTHVPTLRTMVSSHTVKRDGLPSGFEGNAFDHMGPLEDRLGLDLPKPPTYEDVGADHRFDMGSWWYQNLGQGSMAGQNHVVGSDGKPRPQNAFMSEGAHVEPDALVVKLRRANAELLSTGDAPSDEDMRRVCRTVLGATPEAAAKVVREARRIENAGKPWRVAFPQAFVACAAWEGPGVNPQASNGDMFFHASHVAERVAGGGDGTSDVHAANVGAEVGRGKQQSVHWEVLESELGPTIALSFHQLLVEVGQLSATDNIFTTISGGASLINGQIAVGPVGMGNTRVGEIAEFFARFVIPEFALHYSPMVGTSTSGNFALAVVEDGGAASSGQFATGYANVLECESSSAVTPYQRYNSLSTGQVLDWFYTEKYIANDFRKDAQYIVLGANQAASGGTATPWGTLWSSGVMLLAVPTADHGLSIARPLSKAFGIDSREFFKALADPANRERVFALARDLGVATAYREQPSEYRHVTNALRYAFGREMPAWPEMPAYARYLSREPPVAALTTKAIKA